MFTCPICHGTGAAKEITDYTEGMLCGLCSGRGEIDHCIICADTGIQFPTDKQLSLCICNQLIKCPNATHATEPADNQKKQQPPAGPAAEAGTSTPASYATIEESNTDSQNPKYPNSTKSSSANATNS